MTGFGLYHSLCHLYECYKPKPVTCERWDTTEDTVCEYAWNGAVVLCYNTLTFIEMKLNKKYTATQNVPILKWL